MLRKNCGMSSIGYRPEAPGICMITSSTHKPRPTCPNETQSA